MWDPSKEAEGPLSHLDTHCLCSGCPAALYPSVPCKYVRPGPGYPPRRAVEMGECRSELPSRPASQRVVLA